MACKVTMIIAVAPITNQLEPMTKAAFNSVLTLTSPQRFPLRSETDVPIHFGFYFDYFYSI